MTNVRATEPEPSTSIGSWPLADRTPAEAATSLLLLLGPLLALLGNAPSDMWLAAATLAFLAASAAARDWRWTAAAWARIALAFWVWIVLAAALVDAEAVGHAAPWLRFPLFALALAWALGDRPDRRRAVLAVMVVGLTAMSVALVIERIGDPTAKRLFGLFSKPKPGWYMLGFGLPAALMLLSDIEERRSYWLARAALVALFAGATVATGEVMITLLFLFGLGVYLLLAGRPSPRLLGLGAAVLAIAIGVAATARNLFERFTTELLERLPWRESSDYYDPWVGGVEVGLQHLAFGVGAGLYDPVCEALRDAGRLSIEICLGHPHQIFVQTFAETGLIGFLLIVAMALALWALAGRAWLAAPAGPRRRAAAAAVALLAVAFFPLASYSDAFGQHRNFFNWLMIGWALALAAASRREPAA